MAIGVCLTPLKTEPVTINVVNNRDITVDQGNFQRQVLLSLYKPHHGL